MPLRSGTHKYKNYPDNVKTPDERKAFDAGGQAAVDKQRENARTPNESQAETDRLNKKPKPSFTSSENVEQKTKDTTEEPPLPQEIVSSGVNNVLNNYRSVTYNFTLSVLDSDEVSSPDSYRDAELKYVILRSGGKGFVGITSDVRGIERVVGTKDKEEIVVHSANAHRDAISETKITKVDIKEMDYSAKDTVNSFNNESAGRFDMYIENVDIESLMTPSDNSNSTLPTNIKFDVTEPYSMNGFLEAMYVAANAAGYDSYLSAVFLFKVEFWGYPDDEELPEPELIDESSRYFPINFTGIEVDVSEAGTKYRCNAVPLGERAFGQPSKIKKPIQMSGSTVGEILDDFIKNFNQQIINSDTDSKSDAPRNFDSYEIKFPSMSEDGILVDTPNKNIRDKKIGEILKDNLLYKMIDPGNTDKPNAYKTDNSKQPTAQQQAKQPESIKYNPGQTVINFAQDMSINDVIASVIRDSDYVKDILKDLGKKPNVPDEFGFLDYFIITTEIKDKKEKNPDTKKPYQIFTYLVTPYKVHYTRVPGYSQVDIKEETFKKSCNRTYNYIYTGQNIDILNFKLNFNNLFFEAVPANLGNKPTVGTKDTAAPANTDEVKSASFVQAPGEQGRGAVTQIPKPPIRVVPSPIAAYTGGTASQPKNDPYSLLARGMHESIINSNASMITGEMEILGDPFYLVSGGIGNNRPKRKKNRRGRTDDGDADHTYGSVLILINFRNPVDINSFEDGGMIQFDGNRVPFSGAYQVNKATSSFRDGVFKQKLEIMRMPGQVLDSNLRDSDPADRRTTKPDLSDQVTPDETIASNPSQRIDYNTVAAQLSRGLPSPGLPNEASNFTNASGGLGGTSQSLLNQTAGSIADAGSPTSKNPIVGQPLPDPNDISSNIRLNAAGLVNLSQGSLGNSALIASAANVLTGNLSAERAIGALGGSLINSAISYARNIPNVGSGIGKGANVSLDAVTSSPAADLNANQLKQGLDIDTSKISLSSIASSISDKTVDAAKNLGNEAKNLVGGIGDKIKSLTSSPSDPNSIASTAGLDASVLSGLRGSLQSKLPSQISSMISSVPEDVNLSKAAAAGLVLDYIPASKISNIPATPPYTTAPIPEVDTTYANEVVKKSGLVGLMNLYGVSSPSKLSTNLVPSDLIASAKNKISNLNFNPLDKISSNINSVDMTSAYDKFKSGKSQLSGLTGEKFIPDTSSVGSAASTYGSISSVVKDPITSAVGKDPTALSYSGTDPATRARLGLPPLPPSADNWSA